MEDMWRCFEERDILQTLAFVPLGHVVIWNVVRAEHQLAWYLQDGLISADYIFSRVEAAKARRNVLSRLTIKYSTILLKPFEESMQGRVVDQEALGAQVFRLLNHLLRLSISRCFCFFGVCFNHLY